MADSPRPDESLVVKKDPDVPVDDPIVSWSSSGWMLVSAFIVIMFNLVADLLYGVLDPRIRYE